MNITVWPKVYADPHAGVDDAIARQKINAERDRAWAGRPMAIGVENRKWCEALHRGRWPK